MPEREVDVLIKKVDRPADAYMTLKGRQGSESAIEKVQREYEANKGGGWGAIANNLGIKPGSAEFHEIKKSGVGAGDDEGKGKSKKGKGKGKGKGHD